MSGLVKNRLSGEAVPMLECGNLLETFNPPLPWFHSKGGGTLRFIVHRTVILGGSLFSCPLLEFTSLQQKG